MRAGEAIAQQRLRDAGAVDDRDCDLIATLAAVVQRGVRCLESDLSAAIDHHARAAF